MQCVLDIFRKHLGQAPLTSSNVRVVLQECGVKDVDVQKLLSVLNVESRGGITCEEFITWLYTPVQHDSPLHVGSDTGGCEEQGGDNHNSLDDDVGTPPALERAKSMMRELGMDAVGFDHYLEFLRSAFSRQTCIEKTEMRGITLSQLRSVEAFVGTACGKWKWCDGLTGNRVEAGNANLYHVNSWLIKPATNVEDCAFVELLAKSDQPPTWFCSHWWGEPVSDFIKCVATHQLTRKVASDASTWSYWVCAYANRQHSLAEELTMDPKQTSFFRAMQQVQGVLLILDANATPFRRLWCGFEMYVALSEDDENMPSQGDAETADLGTSRMLLDVATTITGKPTAALLTDGLTEVEMEMSDSQLARALQMHRQASFPLEVLRRGLRPKLHEAQTSEPKDRKHILNSLAGNPHLEDEPASHHENYQKANDQLGGIFARAGWEPAMVEGKVSALKVPEALHRDPKRSKLHFNWSTFDVSDADLEDLSRGLPLGLCQLELEVAKCQFVGDAGIAVLASALPSTLQRLDLQFRCRKQITDAGVAALAQGLPAGLKHLLLSLEGNGRDQGARASPQQIGDAGLAALAVGLPDSLQGLAVKVRWCKEIGDAGLAAIAPKLPLTLRRLQIDLAFCDRIGDAGLAVLALGLHPSLQHLSLNFAFCERVTDNGVLNLAGALPTSSLLSLHLDFTACTRVTSAGLAALASSLPSASSLQLLRLDLGRCKLLDDAGLAALAVGLPSGLKNLQLELSTCNRVSDSGLAVLGQKLPHTLRQLQLLCKGCERITDAGLAALTSQLPANLSHLQLGLESCYKVTDAGLAVLASSMPSTLRHLQLSLEGCLKIGDAGLATLASSLPPELQLQLSIKSCKHVSREAQQAALRGLALKSWKLQRAPDPALAESVTAAEATVAPAKAATLKVSHHDRAPGRRKAEERSAEPVTAAVPAEPAQAPMLVERVDSSASLASTSALCLPAGGSSSWTMAMQLPLPLDSLPCLRLALQQGHGMAKLALRFPEEIDDGHLEGLLMHSTSLPGAHALPSSLQHLQLQFNTCTLVGDAGVNALAKRLPVGLQHLQLDFSFCEKITSAGIAALAMSFPPELQHLQLSFRVCRKIGDDGIAAIAARLPATVTWLHLDFTNCEKVSDPGLASFAQHLPGSLQHLHFVIQSCQGVADPGLAALAPQQTPISLQHLHLSFGRLKGITDSGLAGLSALLRRTSIHVQLNFEGCDGIGNSGLAALASALQPTVQHLQLQFEGCDKIGSSGILALAEALPPNLQHLQLGFERCDKVCDTSLVAIGARTPATVQNLQLNFILCNQVSDSGLAALGSRLPSSAEHVQLKLRGCKLVGDPGIAAIAEGLPATLQHLQLHVEGCEKIGNPGMAALAAKLPATMIQHLQLLLRGCLGVGDPGLAALGSTLPATVQHLQLHLDNCQGISYKAREAARLGPSALRSWASKTGAASLGDLVPAEAAEAAAWGNLAPAESAESTVAPALAAAPAVAPEAKSSPGDKRLQPKQEDHINSVSSCCEDVEV